MLGVIPKIDVVTVGAVSKTLATLLGVPLQADTSRIFIRPHFAGVFMANGTATWNDDPLVVRGTLLEGSPADLGALEFLAPWDFLSMTVIQNGVLWFADLPGGKQL